LRVPNALTSADPLAPIIGTLAAVRARQGAARVQGVAPGLLVADRDGWFPAGHFADGTALPSLIDAAVSQWTAPRHVATALAWKQYTYWLLLPAVLGYARSRRLPVMSAGNVLVQPCGGTVLVRLGLDTSRVTVLAGDPLAGAPGTRVVPDEAALLDDFRRTVLDEHLAPMLEHLHGLAQLGRRTLLGSVASAICYALVRTREELPSDVIGDARALMAALDVDDLVQLTPDGRIRRRTCCLAFALPEPKICDSCCIR
jgi:hypothetical protein